MSIRHGHETYGALQEEIEELQQRLTELKDRRRCLEQQIEQEEQQVEAEELEGSVLRACTVAQLRDMSRTLQDLVTSENRTQISVSTPPSILRLAPNVFWRCVHIGCGINARIVKIC